MRTLLIDCNYVSHQAFHVLHDLESRDGIPSGVVFGFLNRIVSLGHEFSTNDFLFCWDSRHSFRREIDPEYKRHRRTQDEETKARYRILWEQMDELRGTILSEIGFSNVFEQHGIEADDLMAILSAHLQNLGLQSTIVTSDEDLFQCLGGGVDIHNPSSKKTWTLGWFLNEYGIQPERWVDVKVIAGCPGDNVKGVDGVGVKTAVKYLLGELGKKSKKLADIKERIDDLYDFNEVLVRLPFHRTRLPEIMPNDFSLDGLMDVAARYDMMSYIDGKQAERWADLFERRFRPDEDPSEIGRRKRDAVVDRIKGRRRKR